MASVAKFNEEPVIHSGYYAPGSAMEASGTSGAAFATNDETSLYHMKTFQGELPDAKLIEESSSHTQLHLSAITESREALGLNHHNDTASVMEQMEHLSPVLVVAGSSNGNHISENEQYSNVPDVTHSLEQNREVPELFDGIHSEGAHLDGAQGGELIHPSQSYVVLHSHGAPGKPQHGRRSYDCDVCGWRFTLKCNLLAHVRRHTGEKPYVCSECDRKFTQSSLLTVHMRTHTGEKPFRCPHCDRAFSRSGNLQTHIRTHNDSKPFKCEQCHKRFSQRVNMKLHMRVHTGQKPYQCGVCNRAFTSCSNMRRHWRQIHPQHPEPALGVPNQQPDERELGTVAVVRSESKTHRQTTQRPPNQFQEYRDSQFSSQMPRTTIPVVADTMQHHPGEPALTNRYVSISALYSNPVAQSTGQFSRSFDPNGGMAVQPQSQMSSTLLSDNTGQLQAVSTGWASAGQNGQQAPVVYTYYSGQAPYAQPQYQNVGSGNQILGNAYDSKETRSVNQLLDTQVGDKDHQGTAAPFQASQLSQLYQSGGDPNNQMQSHVLHMPGPGHLITPGHWGIQTWQSQFLGGQFPADYASSSSSHLIPHDHTHPEDEDHHQAHHHHG